MRRRTKRGTTDRSLENPDKYHNKQESQLSRREQIETHYNK